MASNALKSTPVRFALRLVVWYAVIAIVIAACQRNLLYFPSRGAEPALVQTAATEGVEAWRDREGQIIGWRRAARAGRPAANRLLVFHGNGGFALHRTDIITGFENLEGGRLWEVYLFEYPGYGARPGKPSKQSFSTASAAAIEQLRAEDSRPIYVLGQSLGCAVACELVRAPESPVAGLALLTPFASLRETAQHHYPWLPIGLLLRDRWDNVESLQTFHRPVAVLVADRDSVIPPAHGRRLFTEANEPKRLWVIPEIDHNDMDFSPSAAWWKEVSDFVLQRPASPCLPKSPGAAWRGASSPSGGAAFMTCAGASQGAKPC